MTQCPQCHATLKENPFFCDLCGSLDLHPGSTSSIECENHSGQPAVAVCSVCGKPVCGDCALRKDGKFFCECADHIGIGNEWVTIHGCASEFEADLFLANLVAAGIEARFFSPGSHISLAWTPIDAHVRVMVKKPDRDPAREVLIRLGLLEEDIPHENS